jgi:hypothetical protein
MECVMIEEHSNNAPVKQLDKEVFFTMFAGLIGKYVQESFPDPSKITYPAIFAKVEHVLDAGTALPAESYTNEEFWTHRPSDERELMRMALVVADLCYKRTKYSDAASTFFNEATVPDFYNVLRVLYGVQSDRLGPVVSSFCKTLNIGQDQDELVTLRAKYKEMDEDRKFLQGRMSVAEATASDRVMSMQQEMQELKRTLKAAQDQAETRDRELERLRDVEHKLRESDANRLRAAEAALLTVAANRLRIDEARCLMNNERALPDRKRSRH